MNDYGTLTETGTIVFRRALPGPIERVWAYLTESEKRGTWLASGEMELREGGRVEHVFRHSELTSHDDAPPAKYANLKEHRMHGRITRCEPLRLLSYTWEGDSEVTFELTPRGDDVLLVLTHRRLHDRAAKISVAGGWHTHLGILADRLNGTEPRPFWKTHTRLEADYEQRIAR